MKTECLYPVHFQFNGVHKTECVRADQRLLDLLRDDLRAWEVKEGCGKGDCGSCAILINGEPRLACLVLAVQVEQATLTTARGLGDEEHLHPLQQAFIEYGAAQCGFCMSGVLVTASALLARNPYPTREEIRSALAGNLCLCTGYQAIVDAIEAVSRQGCTCEFIAQVCPVAENFEEREEVRG